MLPIDQTTGSVLEASSAELALRLRQQELVAAFGVFALQAPSDQVLLEEASVVAARGLEVRFAKVLEYLPSESCFLVRAGVGWNAGVVGTARLGDDRASPAGYAFRTGLPTIANHLPEEKRFRVPALLADHGVHSAINVIVRMGEVAPFGVLEGDSTGRGDFSQADIAFMQSLANTLAAALEMRRRQHARDDLLRQRGLLLQEVHHRVKNSLQLVQTLLQLQARTLNDEQAKQQLAQAAGRVMTIAAVHRRLYESGSVGRDDVALYLRGLLDDMRAILGSEADRRPIELDVAPTPLAADQLTPIGLIVSELVMNAIKYGAGRVRVSGGMADGAFRLAVEDEGIGFPEAFDPAGRGGLGMRLVGALAKGQGPAIRVDRTAAGGRVVVDITLEQPLEVA